MIKKFWAGFCEGKLHIREIDTGFGGFGADGKLRAPAIFPTRAAARREYKDVRLVEIREIRPAKFR